MDDPQVLWRRFGGGDRRAFNALYRRHQDDVLRFCQALLHDSDDAREAANSTWAAVWGARQAAERDVPLRPWLFRIAHNEAIDILRRRRPHEELDTTIPAPDDTAADAELHERLATLRADLMTLTDHQRTALVLREMSGLGHEEIAAVLEVTPGAAKQTIYEARQALIEAEGGRSLSCDLVRRDLATGDRRVLRGRRIRAHLRGCAACREFAGVPAVPGGPLRSIVPVPAAAALMTQLGGPAADAVAGSAAGGAGASKLAAAVVTLVVGAGATAGLPAHGADEATAAAAPQRAPSTARAPAPGGEQVRVVPARAPRPARALRRASRRHIVAASPAAVPATPRRTVKPAAAAAAAAAPRAASEAARPAQPRTAEAPPSPAGTLSAPAPALPPDRAKKNNAAPRATAPDGQVRVSAGQVRTPPGQVWAPRGQAKEAPRAAGTTTTLPRGQAKQDAPRPGHADKSSHAAPAGPAGQSPQTSSTPALLGGAVPAGVGQGRGKAKH